MSRTYPPGLEGVWREVYDERVAIRQHDGELSKEEAEREALEDTRDLWRKAHGVDQ